MKKVFIENARCGTCGVVFDEVVGGYATFLPEENHWEITCDVCGKNTDPFERTSDEQCGDRDDPWEDTSHLHCDGIEEIATTVEFNTGTCLACTNAVGRHEDFCIECYTAIAQTTLYDDSLPF